MAKQQVSSSGSIADALIDFVDAVIESETEYGLQMSAVSKRTCCKDKDAVFDVDRRT
jgi:hypothetical protein